MKAHKKTFFGVAFLVLILLVVVLSVVVPKKYAAYRLQKSYYPMAGEVTILDKSTSEGNHYIVIEDPRGDRFTLSCSERDYDTVNVGDKVDCERHESTVTYEGTVHKIEPIT